jgi:hypothetical protein
MIGFDHLGNLGRLCNQMFQYAALMGISSNRKFERCIPPNKGLGEYYDYQLFNCFDIPENIKIIGKNYIQESKFSFDKTLFDECPDNSSLFGYFQTEKYFSHIEDEIRKVYTFKESIHDACVDAISTISNPVALHIRRTDYLTDPNHHCLPLDYYEQALRQFDSKRNVIVFSDDIEWCYNQSLFSDDRFLMSEEQDAYHDLCLMTLCQDHIIANSSYSWWGAWLSQNGGKVISPRPSEWFGSSNNNKLDTSDIIPDRWIKL